MENGALLYVDYHIMAVEQHEDDSSKRVMGLPKLCHVLKCGNAMGVEIPHYGADNVGPLLRSNTN